MKVFLIELKFTMAVKSSRECGGEEPICMHAVDFSVVGSFFFIIFFLLNTSLFFADNFRMTW